MISTSTIIYEEEYQNLKNIAAKLCVEANARAVFLIDKNGQPIVSYGEMNNLDTTSLASLTAGNVAATDGLANLVGEKEFPVLSHEGVNRNIHIAVVAQRIIVVVIFDERTNLGLVRLRVRRAATELTGIIQTIHGRTQVEENSNGSDPLFLEITDEDIDSLFENL